MRHLTEICGSEVLTVLRVKGLEPVLAVDNLQTAEQVVLVVVFVCHDLPSFPYARCKNHSRLLERATICLTWDYAVELLCKVTRDQHVRMSILCSRRLQLVDVNPSEGSPEGLASKAPLA